MARRADSFQVPVVLACHHMRAWVCEVGHASRNCAIQLYTATALHALPVAISGGAAESCIDVYIADREI
jgi:hypothetical protein